MTTPEDIRDDGNDGLNYDGLSTPDSGSRPPNSFMSSSVGDGRSSGLDSPWTTSTRYGELGLAPDEQPFAQGRRSGDARAQKSPHDGASRVPDADDPIYGERAAIGQILGGSNATHRPDGSRRTPQSSSRSSLSLPADAGPEIHETDGPLLTIDFLKPDDVASARRVSEIINDPRNKNAFVSPYPTVEDDPECKAILQEAGLPDKKIALVRDRSQNIIGTAQLSYHPDRADMVTWYLGALDRNVQDQDYGPHFIQALARATFDVEAPKDRDGNPRTIDLIEIHVILNENNHPKDFSNTTRKQFPPAYRLMRKLRDYVDETAYYPPHIKTTLPDGRVVKLAVATFTIRCDNFDAFEELQREGYHE